jgi:hypothetical protein
MSRDSTPTLSGPDTGGALFTSGSATALNEYLTLMEDTEAPRQYLIWALIAAAAALIGGNAAFKRGPLFTQSANLFVVLLGPSGVRKSSAITPIVDMLRRSSVNFGPTDTGGQRQGIMSAMVGLHKMVKRRRFVSVDEVPPLYEHLEHSRRPQDIFFSAPELGRILGTGAREMADFFNDLYDRAPIDYQTRASETIIRNGIATLLGGSTPQALASILPDGATGHGILSRIVFVWAGEKYKDVPIPPVPAEEWYDAHAAFVERLLWIDHNRQDFTLDAAGDSAYTDLYTFSPELGDPRLESYRARRSGTLLKVSMCLAALRNSTMINEEDVQLAHAILLETEPDMHKALEYFGRNKTFIGRMAIIQFLKSRSEGAATMNEIVAAIASDLNRREADEVIQNMLSAKELVSIGGYYVLRDVVNNEMRDARKGKR